jgi:hypothetical protein
MLTDQFDYYIDSHNIDIVTIYIRKRRNSANMTIIYDHVTEKL